MIELKPCPFCGEQIRMIGRPADDMFGFWHKSMSGKPCPLRVGVFLHRVSEEESIEIWNRRVSE